MKVFLRNGKLITLMLGHLTVDSYVGIIPRPLSNAGQLGHSALAR